MECLKGGFLDGRKLMVSENLNKISEEFSKVEDLLIFLGEYRNKLISRLSTHHEMTVRELKLFFRNNFVKEFTSKINLTKHTISQIE